METTPARARGLVYGIDDVPRPLPRALGLGLQHVLTMFGATVAVPLLLGPVMQMTPGEIALLVSSVMICSGVATFLQVHFGSRLPIIQGVSFSFLGPFFAIIGTRFSTRRALVQNLGSVTSASRPINRQKRAQWSSA